MSFIDMFAIACLTLLVLSTIVILVVLGALPACRPAAPARRRSSPIMSRLRTSSGG
jgi:hypothetical protein